MRYIVVKQWSQAWSVFDRVFGLPAQMGGQMLVGLTRHEAKREASKANESLLRWSPAGVSTKKMRGNDRVVALEQPQHGRGSEGAGQPPPFVG